MDFEEYYKRAIEFYRNDELDKALENSEAALKIQPDNANVRKMVNILKELITTVAQREHCEREASRWGELTR